MKRLLLLLIIVLTTTLYPLFSASQCLASLTLNSGSCINGTVTAVDMSTFDAGDSITQQIWIWGDGKSDTITNNFNPVLTHSYFSNTHYTISYKIFTRNGCYSSDSVVTYVSIKPQVAFSVGSDDRMCGYTNIRFTNMSATSSGDSLYLLWKFSDDNSIATGNIIDKKYTKSGNYTAKLIVTADNGCTDSLTKQVSIVGIIGAAFKVDKPTICSSDTAVISITYQGYTSSSGFIRKVWNFGDGSSLADNSTATTVYRHKYSSPGKYKITLTYETTTCTLYYYDSVNVGMSPQAAFSSTPETSNLCGSQKMNFSNLSSSPLSNPLTYQWYINNSLVSTVSNPAITYYENGSFPITLKATDSISGCFGQLDAIVNVSGVDPKPKAGFGYETDNTNLLRLKFYDSSSINSPGVIDNYIWDFGDGTQLTTVVKDTAHTYASKGTFIVKHIIRTLSGCADTISRTIVVDSIPVSLCYAGFFASSYICIGNPLTITDYSVNNNGNDSLVRQIWNYGDGLIDTLYSGFASSRTHTYQNPGIYSITLSILTKRGCTNSSTRTLTVRSFVKSKFSYSQIPDCNNVNQVIQFTNESSYVGTLSTRWIYGDGNIESNPVSLSHTYAPGNYTVQYLTRVSTCMSVYDTLTKLITVLPKSKADFYYRINELKIKTINFSDNCTKGINPITGYWWDFGDGTFSTETNPEHTYSGYGTYTVKHSFLTETAGCIPDTVTYSVQLDSFVTLSPAISQSNMGTDFWAGYGYVENMKRTATNTSRPFLSIYLAADENPATVLVDIPNMPISKKTGTGFPKVVYVPAKSVVEVSGFPIGDPYDAYNASNYADTRLYFTGITERAIRITSNQPIGAWEHVYSTNNTAGGTLLLPTKMWSTSYIVQSRGGTSNNSNPNSFFFVIAESDSTKIEFTPSADIIDSSTATLFTQSHTTANVLYKAGITYSKLLNKGEVFNAMGYIASGNAVDLSGTKITSQNPFKRIAVFGGNGRVMINANVCSNTAGSDNLIQQIFPKAVWGTRYLTAPTKTMETGVYRITVDDNSTIVSVNGTQLPPSSLISNRYYEITKNQPLIIESDKRVMVTQYIVTPGCPSYTSGNNGGGDPEMINLTPLKYGTKKVTIFSPNFKTVSVGASASYVNIIVRKEGLASFRIDNSTLVDTGTSSYLSTMVYGSSSLINIQEAANTYPGDANYAFIRVKVATGAAHTLQCDSSFLAIAYGMTNGETIGYNVGFNFNTLPSVYQYLGTGNWTNSINWLGNKIPPNPLPMGSEIIISGNCTLNVPQTIEDGARLVVETGGNLTLNGNLSVQQ